MQHITVMQGDQYPINFRITRAGTQITPEDVADVEVSFSGDIIKYYSDGGVTYSDGWWHFDVTEKETFALPPRTYEIQARVKFVGDEEWIRGGILGTAEVVWNTSKKAMS